MLFCILCEKQMGVKWFPELAEVCAGLYGIEIANWLGTEM